MFLQGWSGRAARRRIHPAACRAAAGLSVTPLFSTVLYKRSHLSYTADRFVCDRQKEVRYATLHQHDGSSFATSDELQAVCERAILSMSLPSETIAADVRAALQAFQDGYTHRSSASLGTFMNLFVADASLEVVGTSAVARATDEWCVGRPMVRALVEADWHSWGDLRLDVAGATIHVHGDVAWLATTGTLSQTLPLKQRFSNITTYFQGVADRQTELDVERELLLVILGSASTLASIRDGEHYVWPLRFTAVLVRQQFWQFHQIHFSYPTIHDPDVRLP